jgi:AcrR family transcriptional regulator
MDNRETILAKALDLFTSRGYDAVGVQEIADAAAITKPTLYHYFGSKQGLLKSLLTALFDKPLEKIRAAAEYAGDLTLTLRRVAAAYFGFAGENPIPYRLLLSLFFAPKEGGAAEAIADINKSQFSILEDLFKLAASNHGNMRGRHAIYAATYLGLINNCIALALNGCLVLDDALLQRAVHQFEHGIYS